MIRVCSVCLLERGIRTIGPSTDRLCRWHFLERVVKDGPATWHEHLEYLVRLHPVLTCLGLAATAALWRIIGRGA